MTMPEKNGIIHFNSPDVHISRWLSKYCQWGIVHSPAVVAKVEMLHLKWIVQDRPIDYETLLPHQYFNHFQNNKEITSKSFLKKNLENYLMEDEEDFYGADNDDHDPGIEFFPDRKSVV